MGTYVDGRDTRQRIMVPPSDPPVVVVDAAFTPQYSTKETTTPVNRSTALLIRLAPVTAIYLIFAITIAIAFELRMVWGMLIFAALTWWSYYTMDAAERWDSATGVEHHRIEAAKDLAEQKMAYDAQVRMQITQAYLKQLEGPTYDTQTTQQSGRSLPYQ
jgi:hypothetical protein